ncbi:MAG TPA: isoprenylcysteine carboxylmethyltransferase family protein [Phycisphaerales bacterium]|nr:isoprenylcysteine carboxylmethyltransferase family protein [Phycisphaerales bacterium]HMP36906.1 isoprenylcysteine carboxylmethyltransferase family protein [Phycisphaerales bacterium]
MSDAALPSTVVARPARLPGRERLARVAIMAYAAASYLLFFGVLVYLIGFVGNWFVPRGIDDGRVGGTGLSILVNVALCLLFAIQHTIMARPGFKRWWTQFVPPAAERSTFVLVASLCLVALFWLWMPLPNVLWAVESPVAWWGLTALSAAGWTLALLSSFVISHVDLFGLRQAWLRFVGRPYVSLPFRVTGLYRVVRHPLMLGFLIAMWSAPEMTLGRLIFAAMFTLHIVVGTRLEERDLIGAFGETYERYRRRVPSLLPWPRPRRLVRSGE